ncbi:homocysteine S-methyltransferase family protein [Chitinispirillales bacterium ANBcel5]|uniref:homocysteine S-methyltransferase family protein n=1 Tax=Cellulosispirillum alkaliphilum TaxID=3039283 RepID=UPI002A56DBA3|nr:homocysteine S-methyltransferase family protein [Chitinispirillales bacterium ANBcel5]
MELSSPNYLQMVKNGIPLIYDGATGTEIQKMNPQKEDYGAHEGCCEYLNLTRPDIIGQIHRSYLRAGANIIETNTFGGSRPKLQEFGLADRCYEINKAAATVARESITSANPSKPAFVSGSIGPTGFLPSSTDETLSKITFDELVEIFKEQGRGLLDGGVDLFLIETSQDLLEVRAAIYALRSLMSEVGTTIPLQVQVTMDAAGHMLLGSDTKAFMGAVASMKPDVLGLNCSTGPDEMLPIVKDLITLSPLPISILPNAGLPLNIEGKAVYDMDPATFSKKVAPMVTELGVSIVGGCCGTSPEHIEKLSRALEGKKVAGRSLPQKTCYLSTGISGIDLERVEIPRIIGERLNTQGSKKTREFAAAKNYDELYQIALNQVNHGSALLDLCMAANEIENEKGSMLTLIDHLKDRIGIPFCVDTTEPEVMEAALKKNPGSVLINSINLEYKCEKARQILSLARDFACPVVALTIDDEGMASTADIKLELAKKLRDLACGEYGLPEHYLYIDPLVFTLATGDSASASAALESLEALKRIKKEMPGVRTVMGVSNVSFGLKPPARRVLNNLMLTNAVNAGLDAAIYNPLHMDDVETYEPELRKLGEDLLFNRSPDALMNFIEHFEKSKVVSGKKTQGKAQEVALSAEQRLRNAVINRDSRSLDTTIDELLKNHSAVNILNKILLPAMSEVGEKMASGEMILPFVLQAAEVMKKAASILEPYLKGEGSTFKGKLIIATVYGDVHDIGKNLVGSILKNQGYEVLDLGKQVPVEEILKKVKEEKPDAVGLSALLVTTSRQMAHCVEEFAREGISVPLIIGGAAVNKEFASQIALLEDGSEYKGGVYYAKDAFDASNVLEHLKEPSAKKETGAEPSPKQPKTSPIDSTEQIVHDEPYIEPTFYGTGEILVWDSKSVLESLNREKLFKAWWGGGKLSTSDYNSAKTEEFGPVLERLESEIVDNDLVDSRGFYGFFPVITDNDDLIFLDPGDFHTELVSFKLKRGEKTGRSLIDYINPGGDIIGVQAVTIGAKLSERTAQLMNSEDRYSDGYYLNALGNYMVETLAEKITVEIRRALGLDMDVGKRYSFGYAGMPGLEEQKKLIEILGVEERLGISVTEGFQMVPEHSTIGLYIRNRAAQYLG